MKDYTFAISAENKNGQTERFNVDDSSRGYRQSWFKTEESARKHCYRMLDWYKENGYSDIRFMIYGKYPEIGIIESSN